MKTYFNSVSLAEKAELVGLDIKVGEKKILAKFDKEYIVHPHLENEFYVVVEEIGNVLMSNKALDVFCKEIEDKVIENKLRLVMSPYLKKKNYKKFKEMLELYKDIYQRGTEKALNKTIPDAKECDIIADKILDENLVTQENKDKENGKTGDKKI